MSNQIKLTRINPSCVRVQITQPGVEPKGSALNRYGFIMEEAAHREGPSQLELKQGKDDSCVLEAFNAAGTSLFRLEKATLAPRRAMTEFALFDDAEDWIGFGDQTRKRLFHRGHLVHCEVLNVTSYIPVPLFMSTRGYAILVNTTYQTTFDMGASQPDKFGWLDTSGSIDFYVMQGNGFKELLTRYLELTGKPELPPKWSFGLWYLSRIQANDAEVMNDARLFREYGIPCDIIGLEPGWMDESYDFSTNKQWNRKNFPLPSWQKNCEHTFIKALKRMGYHLELWLCNDYDLSYEEERRIGVTQAKEEVSQGSFCPHAEVDTHFSTPIYADKLTKPEEPWFRHLEQFVDWGADFFKQDGASQVCFHPDRLWKGAEMLDSEMHNLYPLLYSRQMNEGFAKYTNRRPLVYTVAGWTGFQHYCGTWTGDTGGRIETLGAMLNTSLLGHSFCTNDMEVATPEGLHFGYLLPWSQIDSWTYFRMPWHQGTKLLAMHQDYSRLRSRLVPYIYSAAWQACQTGLPMLMPLLMEYPDDAECREIRHEYLLGRDLLVTTFIHDIYLPNGTWRDFWNGQEYSGNAKLTYECPDNRGGGLFMRSGAIIPLKPVTAYVEEKVTDTIELWIYPGDATQSSCTLYDDDGVTFAYREGDFTETAISYERSGNTLTIRISPDAKCKVTHWSLVLCTSTRPAHASSNGTELQGQFDEARGEFRLEQIQPGETSITW